MDGRTNGDLKRMYELLRFKGIPFSPCSRNPLHSFIPVVSVNLQEGKKKKLNLNFKNTSSQVCNTLTLLKSSWLSS